MEEELFVINHAGNVLFHYCPESKHNGRDDNASHMIGSFLSAILQFSKMLHDDEISNFEMEKNLIVLTKSDTFNLYYVLFSNKENKKKKKALQQKVGRLRELFEKKFPQDVIADWNGDQSVFYNFKEDLEKDLKKKMNQFFENF